MSFEQVWDCEDLRRLIYSFDRTYHDTFSNVLEEFRDEYPLLFEDWDDDDDDNTVLQGDDFSDVSGFGSIIDLVNFDDDETDMDISDDDTFDDDDEDFSDDDECEDCVYCNHQN